MVNEFGVINAGWFILGIIQVAIAISFFRKYGFDKDKRKLMFGLAFFIITYSHVHEAFLFFFENAEFSLFYENVQYWTFYPLVFAVGIAIHQRFLSTIQFNRIFRCFLLISLLFFLLIVFNPVPAYVYAAPLALLISTEIVFISILNTMKHKDTFNVLMLLATSCFVIGGATLSLNISSNAIFAFFIGDLLLLFMFVLSEQTQTSASSTISNYFTIQKKLSETRAKLRETTERYKRLTDTLPEGVLTINKRGKITYANPEMEKIFDIPFTQSKGTSFAKYMTRSSMIKSTKLLKKIKKGKSVEKVELEAIHRDGHLFPIEVWATPLGDDGKYDGLLCVIRNITQRKKVERNLLESELKYRTVFESTATAMGTFGDDGVITMVNNEFQKLTGFSKDEVEHHLHWYDFVTDEYKKIMFSYHKNRTKKGGNPPTEYDCDIVDKQSNIKTVHVKIGLLSGGPMRIVSLVDITDLKQTHRKLQELNNTLEKKVEERTERIKHLLKQKDEFVNQLSHDLKNPLGPLINLIPLIDEHTTDEEDKEILKVIQRNVGYMKNLVQKTLELARLNSPSAVLKMERIKLKDHIDDIIQRNRFLFEEKQIVLRSQVSSDFFVSADALRLDELINNLFNNAVKYNIEHGSIDIDAFEKDGFVTVSIKDTGLGMTTEQLDHVFDEFYKVDTSRHDFDSSGLGMPICKRIVEKHGGRIWAESVGLGKGSTFYFTLPLHQNAYHDVISKVDQLLAGK